MDVNKVKFEDMPSMMSCMLTELRSLQTKVDTIDLNVSKITAKPLMKIMNINELSALLGKSTSTIYKMVAAEEIPCYKQGKNLSFIESEILEWLTAYKKGDCAHTMAMAEKYLERLQ